MIISPAGIELIQHFEGLRLEAYLDGSGIPTIGWGRTKGVHLGQAITREQATVFLRDDLKEVMVGVNSLGLVGIPQPHFDAFVSFAFNLGVQAFKDSTLLRKYTTGRDCTPEFLRWSLDHQAIIPGLALRRMAERLLFMGRDWRAIV